MSENETIIIGQGRLGRHLKHYFELLELPFTVWDRNCGIPLHKALKRTTTCLLAVSDRGLNEILSTQFELFRGKTILHFSGAQYFKEAIGVHPLMTFADSLYDLETYKTIYFAIDRPHLNLNDLIPGLENRSFYILPEQKPLYHALCSFSGNLTQLLWQFAEEGFENSLGLSRDLLKPYQRQVFKNIEQLESPLTGPLARKDETTLALHLKALPSPLSDIYLSMIQAYQQKGARNES